MIRTLARALAWALMMPFAAANAFEQATHALITQQAYLRSIFASPTSEAATAIQWLGLDTLSPFGADWMYFKIDPREPLYNETHVIQEFERKILATLRIKLTENPAMTWLMVGAIREDDNTKEDPPTPQDVDPGLKRPIHHFFDPYFNRSLVPILSKKNVDWALGTKDVFTEPRTIENNRDNHFTVLDAREAMFRALTLKTFSSGSWLDIAASLDSSTRQLWRQVFWSTTFRALGDVLHLNQDMAQPQHTRNEAHSGIACSPSYGCPGGHSSIFEKYVNARALRTDAFRVGAPYNRPVRVPILPLRLDNYPVPSFALYSNYWSTDPSNQAATGRGLADFSNRSFFTAANNLNTSAYPFPPRDSSKYQVVSIAPPTWDGIESSDATPVYVHLGDVEDYYQNTVSHGVPLTTYGVWDEFLKQKYPAGDYRLNRINYGAMADLLIPRAISFSAGLINFFFRGRLLISLPKEGVFTISDHGSSEGFKTLRVKLRNATAAFIDPQGTDQPQHMRGGTFFAVVRYHKDKQYVDSLDTIVGTDPCNDYFEVVNIQKLEASTPCRDAVEEIVVSEPLTEESLDVNAEKTLKFSFASQPIPYGMTDVVLQIVYRGPLGGETDGVAVGTTDISEPTYFTYQNATDYIHLGDHVYTRAQVNADPSLLALVQPRYCVDYQQSPPRLFDACLNPIDIDLDLSFEDISSPIATVPQLPMRRFLRLAYLTAPEETFNPPVKRSVRAAAKEARLGERDEKGLLYQRSVCMPRDALVVRAREAQMHVVSSTQLDYRISQFSWLRGVNGWHNESCVLNGDNSDPNTWDDRDAVMTDLTPNSDEMAPFPVTIADEYRSPLLP